MGIIGGEMKCFHTFGIDIAKASLYVKTDVKGRRPGERKGLDTPVVRAENYECYMSGILAYQ